MREQVTDKLYNLNKNKNQIQKSERFDLFRLVLSMSLKNIKSLGFSSQEKKQI